MRTKGICWVADYSRIGLFALTSYQYKKYSKMSLFFDVGTYNDLSKDVSIYSSRLFSAPLPLERAHYKERGSNF